MPGFIQRICSKVDVSAETFQKLTDERYLPQIECRAGALKLVELEQAIVKPDSSSLTSLQRRCADVLVKKWATNNKESILRSLQKSPLLLAEVFSRSIDAANEKVHDLRLRRRAPKGNFSILSSDDDSELSDDDSL